ncbi:nucleotidyltransferase family protein [Gemmatimonadota bacterium]
MRPDDLHPFLLALLQNLGHPNPGDPPISADEWERITGEAQDHRVASLLHASLQTSEGVDLHTSVPPEVITRLEAGRAAVTARNLLFSDELVSILGACEEQKIWCAPLRGFALAEDLFVDLSLRPMGDIDLLIRGADLEVISEVLLSLDYERMDRRTGYAADFYYTGKFIKDRHGWVIVEPHWSIAYPPFLDRFDMDAVRDRCRRGEVVGLEAWLLSPVDVLLNLCFHLVHEGREAPLLRHLEIDRLIRKYGPGLDWATVTSAANESGQGFFIHQVLGAVVEMFDTPVPAAVLASLPDELPRTRAGRIASFLADHGDIDGKESLALMLASKGVKVRIRYLLSLLFPATTFMRIQYELTRWYQYPYAYLKRFGYFLREGIRGVFTILRPRR